MSKNPHHTMKILENIRDTTVGKLLGELTNLNSDVSTVSILTGESEDEKTHAAIVVLRGEHVDEYLQAIEDVSDKE